MRKAVLAAAAVFLAVVIAQETGKFPLLSTTVAIGKQPAGFFLLPTNQLLRPWGEQAAIQGRPVDLAFDSQKRMLAVLNWHSVEILEAVSGAAIASVKTRPTSYTGIAFRPGDRELWVSETGADGPDSVLVIKLSATGHPEGTERINMPGHPLPCGIAFSTDGGTAYVALSRNNSVAVFSAGKKQLLRRIDVGMAPFSVAYAAQHGKVFVSNRGGRRPVASDSVAPSSGSEIVTDPQTGASASGTVSVVDVETDRVTDVAVGLAPSAVALSPDESFAAITNSHSDTVSILNTSTLKKTDVKIPTWPESTVGSQPDALAFSPDGRRLYVACAGNNAIAILSRTGADWSVQGAVPTGWFPSAIAVDSSGGLRVLNIKGTGNTSNATGNFNSREYEGSLTTIPALLPAQIAAGTREVLAANSPKFEPAGGIANLSSLGIKHVFFIIKENRTYDQVFGDVSKANGDPKLTMYGRDVTPNHHALAEKYVLLDNFHTGGAISFDGHQWLMQAFVSDYVERAFASSPRGYAWNMADALTVAPTGFFWLAATKPLNVRIYGEFCLPARWDPLKQSAVDITEADELTWTEYWNLYKAGKWQTAVGSKSGVPAMARYFDPRYPHDSTSIPDQIRAEEFLREYGEFEKKGTLPNLMVITLNNDHTNGTAPGSPTPRAMVADDDLALGRMVEAISHSKDWASSLILAVEDDAQDGVDHVDGHRTVALAIGPHIRRGVVDSNHYNHTSMVKTIQEIFEIPARTRFLTSARTMSSVFTDAADSSGYTHLIPKVALDEMNPNLQTLTGRRLWAARKSLAMNWKHPDEAPQDVLNRILWWDSKGYNTPYPVR